MIKSSASVHLSPIAPLETDTELDTETLAIQLLRRLLVKNVSISGTVRTYRNDGR